jgi:hypothetical protein
LQLSFNGFLKIDFQGSRVTSDGGLVPVRELDERLGFGDLIAQQPTDSRRGKNTQLAPTDVLHQSVYSRIAGHASGEFVFVDARCLRYSGGAVCRFDGKACVLA